MKQWQFKSALAVATAMLLCRAALTQPPVTIKTVTNAWADREARIRSGRITWVETRTIPKGAVSEAFAPVLAILARQRPETNSARPAPPEDTTFKFDYSFSFDGDRVRYAGADPVWSPFKQEFRPNPVEYVFDGSKGKALDRGAAADHPDGKVTNDNPIEGGVSIAPVVMSFLPTSRQMQLFPVYAAALTGRKAIVDGKPCLELQCQRATYIQRAWVDPSRDFAMVRYLDQQRERTCSKLDVHYRKEAGEWIPDRWEIVELLDGGKLNQSIRATVTRVEINASLAASEYNLDFPKGTLVRDETEKGKVAKYIVKDRGQKRPILASEKHKTYQELLNSEPASPLRKSALAAMTAAIVVALLSASWLLWRRGLIRRSRS